MHRNQYYISNTPLTIPSEFNVSTFGDFHIYTHPSLFVSSAQCSSHDIFLLGYIIDPLHPLESNDEILRNLCNTCSTKEYLFCALQLLSGRFVLLFRTDLEIVAVTDTCSSRQLYYGFIDETIILTSSELLFLQLHGYSLMLSDLKKQFINMAEYTNNEFAWIGDKSLDSRLMKVLPNHYLNITARCVYRIPLYFDKVVSQKNVLEYSSCMLEGSIHAITRRYHVVQPLTGGWDSRALLASSKNVRDNIEFYVIDFGNPKGVHPDVRIAQSLSTKLGLKFKAIIPEKLREDFLTVFSKEHVNPRLTKCVELQYHFYNHLNSNIVRVSGIGGEIGRCFYGYTHKPINPDMLLYFSGYNKHNQFVNQEIDRWVDDAKEYCAEYSIPFLDLFYWEQRMGNWGALYSFEQDIAMEEFCPFCNKNLILSILSMNYKERRAVKYIFFRNLIKNLWEDTLVEPINPADLVSTLRALARRYAMIRYYLLRYKDAPRS